MWRVRTAISESTCSSSRIAVTTLTIYWHALLQMFQIVSGTSSLPAELPLLTLSASAFKTHFTAAVPSFISLVSDTMHSTDQQCDQSGCCRSNFESLQLISALTCRNEPAGAHRRITGESKMLSNTKPLPPKTEATSRND